MNNKFITNHTEDNVGVAVADIASGEKVTGACLETNESVSEVTAGGDIPLGHKIALADLAEGANIVKYGVNIGRASREIKEGDYVHVHNVKSIRW